MQRLLSMTCSIAALAILSLAVLPAHAQHIEVTPLDARPALIGPSDYFTGTALIEPLFDPRSEGGAGAATVTFAPGARTAWHSHPAGQTLVVTSGAGWVRERDGDRREIRAGDVVWTPPGVEHWHGATPTSAMRHVAIQEAVDGEVVNWMEHVTDEQYRD